MVVIGAGQRVIYDVGFLTESVDYVYEAIVIMDGGQLLAFD